MMILAKWPKGKGKAKATTFKKCGHPRTPENSVPNGGSVRCKICHRAHARRWQNPTNPKLPLYEDGRDCIPLLAQCWK